ncbi:conjugal transfer protein TraX [Serratia symbiotica]|uniref:conjugal transfer protein TraX n=1 Tax=Serratia symbiotica TaxID=138074 RepID=UPI0030CCDF13|nr:conjugal transfer protein TraX [Serratia symbiotica]
MKTESRGRDRLPEEKPPVPIAKRARWFAINVLVPVSDISQVGRYTGHNVARLWQRIRTVTSCRAVDDYRPANWSQAVADTGLSASTLCRHYRFSLWIWWGLMWLTALSAIGLLLMLVTAGGSVSPTGWLRIGSVLLVMGLLSATGFVHALGVNYRLWQLEAQRVSASEQGGFQAFLRETRWFRRVLTAGLRR